MIGKPKHVIDQRVPEILDLVGLGDKLNNYPDELSGGEQQRVSIARACVNRPLVLLADEPTGNLDPSTSVEIMRLLDKVNRIGTTVVMATHDQAIVDAMRRRVIELEQGQGHPRPGPRGLQLMARFEYLFRETTSGLRRNGLVAFAAISTTFIALLLFGLALLISRQVNLMIEATTGNVEVAVYLSDPVNPDTVASLTTDAHRAPRRRGAWTSRARRRPASGSGSCSQDQPALVNNVDCDALPASLRVKLSDPEQYAQVAAVLVRPAGQSPPRDRPDRRPERSSWTGCSRSPGCSGVGVLMVSFVMLVSAAILIANTVRMGLFARRKEIGIMKLVGATNWRIRIPFLVEGFVREPDRRGRRDLVPVRAEGRVHQPALRDRIRSCRG